MRRDRSIHLRGMAFFLVLLLAGCKSATEPEPDKVTLSSEMEKLVHEFNIPGAAGVMVNHSSVVDVQARGIRRSGNSDPVTADDFFHIGSITKSMTASMIGILVDQGILGWDSKPSEFIPDLADSVDPGYREVTLLDLLRHRGGAPADEDLSGIPVFPGTLSEQRVKGSQWVLKTPPAVTPGTFRYSNAGYVIAAAMAESATGRDWRALMDSLLFRPLGIEAFYGWPAENGSGQPSGHEPQGSSYRPVEPSADPPELRFIEPAGFISMAVSDLGKFMQLLLDARQGRPRLISQASFDMLHTPEGDYGCGLQILNTADGRLLWHNGSNTYFFSQMYVLPDRDLGVAVFVNAGGQAAGLLSAMAAENVLEAELE